MGNTELVEAIRNAGIPSSYVKTTLPKEGCQDLRELLDSQALVVEDRVVGVSFYARDAKSFTKARRVFFVFAKECVICGYEVRVIDLITVIEMSDTPVASAKTVRSLTDLLFIPDFAEYGALPPFDGDRALKVRTFLRKLIDNGVGLCLLSDRPTAPAGWYPESLVNMIDENTTRYIIGV